MRPLPAPTRQVLHQKMQDMDNDFIIRRAGDRWRVVALSDRGKAFARSDPRFEDGEAILDAAQTRAIHDQLLKSLLFSGLPDGLPPPDGGLIAVRILFLLGLILIPLALFALLH